MDPNELDGSDIAMIETLCVMGLEHGYIRLRRYMHPTDISSRYITLQVRIFGVWMTLLYVIETKVPQNFSP